ncbi:hypothetical protein LZ667_09855 [Hafnia alvei]|uniref:hypothetical protein n=1 Tax=Hafnia alvei TaxID=569 RepID=UPI001F2971B2|nr:hypothetical protein [Hafnia alvei]MCE9871704.1 hypothetical protein [Hafnia alvei]
MSSPVLIVRFLNIISGLVLGNKYAMFDLLSAEVRKFLYPQGNKGFAAIEIVIRSEEL